MYCLEEVDNNWKEEFLLAWDILEIEYASALNDNKKILDDRAVNEINKSLIGLEKLINNLLKNYNSYKNNSDS